MSLADPEIDISAERPGLRLGGAPNSIGLEPPAATMVLAEATGAARRGALALGPLAKSVFDFFVAGALLLAALPFILVLAAAIWSVDRHSPFYAQTRVGRHGVPFRVWKLRSMFIDADNRLARHLNENPAAAAEWQRCFKLKDDPRILPWIGNFIRRSSLDELPQLWNILCGEMSLVGPRPFPSYHLDSFSAEFRQLRCSVLPGLTGLWQIQSRSDGDLSDQESWDKTYIRDRCLSLDLVILLRTLPAVLSARGAR